MTTRRLLIVTSLHRDFDARIWRHATGAARLGYRVELICPWDVPPGSEQDGVRFVPFERPATRSARLWATPLRMTGLIFERARDADLIHFHDLDLLPFMALLALWRPVVYDVHENYPEEMRVRHWVPEPLRPVLALLVRHGQWLLARVIGNQVLIVAEQQEDLPRSNRTLYLPNLAARSGFPEPGERETSDLVRVIYSGGHYVENGSDQLVEIVAAVHARDPTIRFIAIDRFDEQAYRVHIRSAIAARGLTEVLEWRAPVPSTAMAELLEEADIALQCNLDVPKQRAAFPTKLTEYMAAGLPTVATDLPRQRALIADNEAGVVIPAGHIDAFVDAICTLTGDRERRRAFGTAARAAFEASLSWESQEPRLASFYDAVLAGAPFRDAPHVA